MNSAESLVHELRNALVPLDIDLQRGTATLGQASEVVNRLLAFAADIASDERAATPSALGETAEEWESRVRGMTREERAAAASEAGKVLEAAALAFTAGIIQAARAVIDPRNGDAVRIMVTRLKNGTLEHRKALADLGVTTGKDDQ